MFLRNNFLSYLAAIFIAVALVILPLQIAFANEESEKHFNQGENYYNSKKYQEAVNEYKAAISIENNNADYYCSLAWAYYELKNYSLAEENFNTSLSLDKDTSNPYRGLAWLYRAQDQDEEAIKYFIEAGQRSFQNENYDLSVQDFTNALDLDYENLSAYIGRGLDYCYLEKYEDALNDFNKVIQLDSDFGMAYQGRALVYRKQGKIEEAKTNYLLAAQKYISSEEYDSARDSINDALSLDENYGEAYFYLGEIEFFQDNYLESLNKYDKAIDLGFVDYLVYANRGYTKFQLKRYEEAIADFDKAIEMDKTFATAYKWRGETYLSLPEDTAANKYENALKDFTKYLELEKDIDEEIKSEYEQKIEMCKTELKNSNIFGYSDNLVENLNESGILGEVNGILKILLIVMILDYLIIIGCGIYEKNLTGGVAARYLALKIIFLLIIMVANALDESETIGMQIRNFIVAIILVHELLSILENAERLGIPVPDWLKNLLQNIKERISRVFR